MTRTRLLVQNPDDHQLEKFNPDNCGSTFASTFYADLNRDSSYERIVVRESTYLDVPHTRDDKALAPFVRHSVVTIDVYDVSSFKRWLLSPQHTTARFKDRFEMSLDEFNNNVIGVCPMPTFKGLYLVSNNNDRHLELSAANFTLTSFHTDNDVRVLSEGQV